LSNALKIQSEAALVLYGSHVVALTAMSSRLGPLTTSYQSANRAIQECVRLDARLVRGRSRLAAALCSWAEFEQLRQPYFFFIFLLIFGVVRPNADSLQRRGRAKFWFPRRVC